MRTLAAIIAIALCAGCSQEERETWKPVVVNLIAQALPIVADPALNDRTKAIKIAALVDDALDVEIVVNTLAPILANNNLTDTQRAALTIAAALQLWQAWEAAQPESEAPAPEVKGAR